MISYCVVGRGEIAGKKPLFEGNDRWKIRPSLCDEANVRRKGRASRRKNSSIGSVLFLRKGQMPGSSKWEVRKRDIKNGRDTEEVLTSSV